jgi:hypothetical protein
MSLDDSLNNASSFNIRDWLQLSPSPDPPPEAVHGSSANPDRTSESAYTHSGRERTRSDLRSSTLAALSSPSTVKSRAPRTPPKVSLCELKPRLVIYSSDTLARTGDVDSGDDEGNWIITTTTSLATAPKTSREGRKLDPAKRTNYRERRKRGVCAFCWLRKVQVRKIVSFPLLCFRFCCMQWLN